MAGGGFCEEALCLLRSNGQVNIAALFSKSGGYPDCGLALVDIEKAYCDAIAD